MAGRAGAGWFGVLWRPLAQAVLYCRRGPQEYEARMAAQLQVIGRQQETIRRQEQEISELRRRLGED